MSINQSMNQFPEHIPGQPYELTPIQFFNFLGLGYSFGMVQSQDFNLSLSDLLNILPKYKRVRIMTESQPRWYHKTESGTIFYIEVINREIKFFVTIPVNRDTEGRQHYNAIRMGNPYNVKVFQN